MSGSTETPLDLQTRFAKQGERGVRRISIEVAGEQVTFTRRDGRVQAICTCGAESCEHHAAALRFFGDEPISSASSSLQPKVRASSRPPLSRRADAGLLAAALDELCLATARAGTSTQDSPSIRVALEQLIAAAPEPLSLSLTRFVGRFHNALATGELAKLAALLAGAQAWTAEVGRDDHSPQALSRSRAWLGAAEGEATDALTDVLLVEVGREWLSGLTRSAIERRYLVDLVGAELYSEERRRGEHEISVGPCPRLVHVAFAELTLATLPARARLLQYTVSPDPSPAHWQRLAELGEDRLPALATFYAEAVRRCPGLAEPVVLFAARELTPGPAGCLRDASGRRLELRDDSDGMLADTLRALAGKEEIVWVLGRLRGLSRGLTLRPISVLLRSSAGLRLSRVT